MGEEESIASRLEVFLERMERFKGDMDRISSVSNEGIDGLKVDLRRLEEKLDDHMLEIQTTKLLAEQHEKVISNLQSKVVGAIVSAILAFAGVVGVAFLKIKSG